MAAIAGQWLKSLIEHAESCEADRTAEAEEQARTEEEEVPGQKEVNKEIPGAAGEPSVQNMFCIPCHRAVNRTCRTCSMLSLKTRVLQCYCAIDSCSLHAGELAEEEQAAAKETHARSATHNEGDQQLM